MGRVLWGAPAPNFSGVCLPTISDLFDDAKRRIEVNEIQSLALIMVDVTGKVSTATVAEGIGRLTLLAGLDISKDRLKAELSSVPVTG